jgi:hypothetical protein
MEKVPLETLLLEYRDSQVDIDGVLPAPYKTFLRQHVLMRLVNLAHRNQAFEQWKTSRGRGGVSDNVVVSDALANWEPEFFMWLCARDFESADGCRDRLMEWKMQLLKGNAEHARRSGYIFVRYFVRKSL